MTQPTLDFTAQPETVYQQHQRELVQEDRRRGSAKSRILFRLQQGPATNDELNDICFRYGARLLELRRDGYTITTTPLRGGLVRYHLHD